MTILTQVGVIELGSWDTYKSRLSARGVSRRDAALSRERRYLDSKLHSSLSYHNVSVDGESRNVAILNSDIETQKTICSITGEPIIAGSLVVWQDNHWLITSVDPNTEVYAKGVMMQCNYYLKWIMPDSTIVKRWCIVSDGTKYMAGETSGAYAGNGMAFGDSRISVSLARDEYTVQLTRAYRFLIDDEDSPTMLAYRLTKPFKLGGVYNGRGVMSFIFTEVNTEDVDNFELNIADYYKYFPKEEDENGDGCRDESAAADEAQSNETQAVQPEASVHKRKVWL